MKQNKYTIHLTCTASQYAKIQTAVRAILPTVTKQQRLLNQYSKQLGCLIKDGLTATEIYYILKDARTDDQEPITKMQVYQLIDAMGYKLKYTLTSKK